MVSASMLEKLKSGKEVILTVQNEGDVIHRGFVKVREIEGGTIFLYADESFSEEGFQRGWNFSEILSVELITDDEVRVDGDEHSLSIYEEFEEIPSLVHIAKKLCWLTTFTQDQKSLEIEFAAEKNLCKFKIKLKNDSGFAISGLITPNGNVFLSDGREL